MARVRERAVFSSKRFTVTAVESLEFRIDGSRHGRLVSGSVKPVALIVKAPDRTYALDMTAQAVDVASLGLPADIDTP